MTIHLLQFLLGLVLMWFASGLVVRGIEKFSKNARISTFVLLFAVLTFVHGSFTLETRGFTPAGLRDVFAVSDE